MRSNIYAINSCRYQKSVVLSFLSIVCSMSAFAANPEKSSVSLYRHEVNVNIGYIYVRSGWSNDYEKNLREIPGPYDLQGTTVLLYKWENDVPKLKPTTPLISASYYYHLKPYLAIGTFFGFCGVRDSWGYPELYELKEKKKTTGDTDVKGTSLFFMPSVKLSVLNSRWCSLYMKLSAGIHYQSLYLDSDLLQVQQIDEKKENHVGFACNVTPFGWEIGTKNLRWFVEFGVGTNSNIQTGLTYRFGEYR